MQKNVNVQGALNYQPPAHLLEHWKTGKFPFSGHLDATFLDLKKYLIVKAILAERGCTVHYSPYPWFDELWHHFIVDDTEAYTTFCQEYLGRFVHHKIGEAILDSTGVMQEIAREHGFRLYTHPFVECCG